MSQSMGSSSSL